MPDLSDTLRAIRRDLREEYLQPHDWPWMIGFSGGWFALRKPKAT